MKNIHNFTVKMDTHSVDWQDLVTVSDIHEQMDVGLVLFPSKFQVFHSLSITSIFGGIHGALNVGKINN
jgi:hypothetical protein